MTTAGLRVVSTSPSGTEICYALGVEPVAVSHACDYPPEVADTPSINVSRITEGSSADRHGQVRDAGDGDHVYDVDVERLRAAEPDLIVSQEVCGVCAVDTTLVESVLGDLEADPEVVGLSANRLEDLFTCIERVAAATGTTDRAQALVEDLRERLAAVEAQVATVDDRPRTAVLEWMDPIHLGANWVPELVTTAGGRYDLVAPGERSSAIEWDAVVDYDPEVLVVAPCSYPPERTLERIDGELASRPGWADLTAVRNGRVYVLDGSSYLTRWTPRLVDATERLAACLHPNVVGEPPEDVLRYDAGLEA